MNKFDTKKCKTWKEYELILIIKERGPIIIEYALPIIAIKKLEQYLYKITQKNELDLKKITRKRGV